MKLDTIKRVIVCLMVPIMISLSMKLLVLIGNKLTIDISNTYDFFTSIWRGIVIIYWMICGIYFWKKEETDKKNSVAVFTVFFTILIVAAFICASKGIVSVPILSNVVYGMMCYSSYLVVSIRQNAIGYKYSLAVALALIYLLLHFGYFAASMFHRNKKK